MSAQASCGPADLFWKPDFLLGSGASLLLCPERSDQTAGFWTWLCGFNSSLKREQPPPPSVVCFAQVRKFALKSPVSHSGHELSVCVLFLLPFDSSNRGGGLQFSSPARGTCFSFLAAFLQGLPQLFPFFSQSLVPRDPSLPLPQGSSGPLKLVSGWPCCGGFLGCPDPWRKLAAHSRLLALGNAMDRGLEGYSP